MCIYMYYSIDFISHLLLSDLITVCVCACVCVCVCLCVDVCTCVHAARNKDNSWPEEIIAVMKEVRAKDKENKETEKQQQSGELLKCSVYLLHVLLDPRQWLGRVYMYMYM